MKNLYLIGMMGAGKSRWARRLAHHLGRPALDLDDYITHKTGRTPAQWFQETGEEGFRDVEFCALEEVSRLRATVVATGGGAPLRAEAHSLLTKTGDVVWLDAPVEVLWRRTQSSTGRPLATREEDFVSRYQARRPLYAQLGRRVDTHRPSAEVWADLTRHQSTVASVSLAPELSAPSLRGDYPVKQLGSLEEAGQWLKDQASPPFMIVASPVVYSLYGPGLRAALGEEEVHHCLIPDGEENKTLATVEHLYGCFLQASLNRSSTVIALGGGVTGDVVGYAAATFLRGVPLVQMPTTLLAQVDSSVGGKVGVNLPQGKNLVGAFYPPLASLQVTPTLHSLPDAVYRQGLAEIVKCALLSGEANLCWLEENAQALRERRPEVLGPAIYAANTLKANIVREDEYDRGGRQVLNLGHTLAHALESSLGYGVLGHGDAVALGLQWALALSGGGQLQKRVRELLVALGFSLVIPAVTAREVMAAMKHDKKHGSRGLTLVLLEDVGVPRLTTDGDPRAMMGAFEELQEAGDNRS